MDCNVVVKATSEGSDLSTVKVFVERTYPLVKPVQYALEMSGEKMVYVPILTMIQELFKNTDVLHKLQETVSLPDHYTSCCDGSYFLTNTLFSSGEFSLPLQLYIDELEMANPLGTSKKIHKLCAVYWVFASLPSKYRSALHTIQLALLCKVPDLKKNGYKAVFSPLLKDISILEEEGVFIESLGQNLKGTVFCVSADNLAAHGLGGFTESFRSEYTCRFCLTTRDQMKSECNSWGVPHENGDQS